jgi:GxxExxY protein
MATSLLSESPSRPASDRTPRLPAMGVVPSDLCTAVIGAALELHRQLGPGLLAVVYEVILARQLRQLGFSVDRQSPVPVTYEGLRWEEGFRADLLIGGRLVVEVVSESGLAEDHERRLATYLRVMSLPVGLMLNFGAGDPLEVVHRVENPRLEDRAVGLAAPGLGR